MIGSGANDPQKYDPTASPRDARPLDPVHLRGRAAGRRLASRRAPTRPSARTRPDTVELWHKITHGRGPGVDPPLPLDRPGREGVRRPRRDHPDRRHARSSTRSRSPTRTRWAPGRSRASDYVRKFRTLADGVLDAGRDRAVPRRWPQRLPELDAGELGGLTMPRPRRGRPTPPGPEGDCSDAALDHAPRRQAGRVPGRAGLRASCCGSRARSTRCRASLIAATRASRASTSRARCSPPTSGLPDIGLTTLTEVAGAGAADRPGDRPARR